MEENTQTKTPESQPQVPPKKEKNTGMAIVAYILFFIPLLTEAKNDPFVKYHVKQGLLLFIGWVVANIIASILPWSLLWIDSLLYLALVVLMVIGIMTAAKGEQKPLPVIGKFSEQFKF
ncbi:hypothetical protein KKA93_02525 [Patescibacteria group bacterium]|nr:hypothetical protein [Patescibacteria group bacterium]MBU1663704.1 hypothetical protein [Patescibacteria group bacterium]MBU2233356.1 hypothetical protein [Patescibacteria group bacterium]MBU2264152.1 hypothetical protein [Patescibacteria group bacterium]